MKESDEQEKENNLALMLRAREIVSQSYSEKDPHYWTQVTSVMELLEPKK